jgi:hypothetical protein
MLALLTFVLLGAEPDVEVRFAFARLDQVPYTDTVGQEKRLSAEPYLAVAIQVINHSEMRKLDYRGAGAAALLSTATLKDEHDNRYKSIDFGFARRVEMQQRRESIYPGKNLIDLYVFEPPVKVAKEFTLTIKDEVFSFGRGFTVKFRADQIDRPDAKPKAEAAPKTQPLTPMPKTETPNVKSRGPQKTVGKRGKSPEEKAAAMLKIALELDGDERAKWLKRLISQYPNTKASKEAARLLKHGDEQ